MLQKTNASKKHFFYRCFVRKFDQRKKNATRILLCYHRLFGFLSKTSLTRHLILNQQDSSNLRTHVLFPFLVGPPAKMVRHPRSHREIFQLCCPKASLEDLRAVFSLDTWRFGRRRAAVDLPPLGAEGRARVAGEGENDVKTKK